MLVRLSGYSFCYYMETQLAELSDPLPLPVFPEAYVPSAF